MKKTLIVVGFQGEHRAAEVLDELQQMNANWALELQDGVAAYRRTNGRLRIEQSVRPREQDGGAEGALFGLFIGAALAAPFTGGLTAAIAASTIGAGAAAGGAFGAAVGMADAIDWKERFGITDEYVHKIGGMIQPGDSAVFALLTANNRDNVVSHFARYGGTVLSSTLSAYDENQVQSVIRA